MELIKVKSASDALLKRVPELYEEAFPPEERTETSHFVAMVGRCPQMDFNAIVDNGEFCGMAVIWNLGICRYLLYLAVLREKRNNGYGAQALHILQAESDLPVIAEVELPIEPIKVRRIKFYERNGFHVELANPQILNTSHSDPRCRLQLISTHSLPNADECQRRVVDVVYRSLHNC